MRNSVLEIILPISLFTAYVIRTSCFVLQGKEEDRCDNGWFLAGSRCYIVIPKPNDFDDAKAMCETSKYKNSSMAELETSDEKSALVIHMRTTYTIVFTGQLFWVGASGSNDSFTWNSGFPVNYTDFYDGSEQDTGCLAFGTTTAEKFQPVNCTEKHIVICEKSPLGNLTRVDPSTVTVG